MGTVTLDTLVEKLMEENHEAIEYGIMRGVRFMFCVGAYPTTIGDLLAAKNVANPQEFVDGLNDFLISHQPEQDPPTVHV